MSAKKDIDVNFTTYLPYDTIPSTCTHLGKITTTQLNVLMDEFANGKPHGCTRAMNAEFTDTVSRRWPRHRQLELSDLFYFYDVSNPETHAPCMTGKKQPQSEATMLKACVHNLRCGKCQDAFMRRTLGVALFPQFYAKKKQK